MPKIKVKGQTVQAGELGQIDRHTDGRTDATNYIISLAARSIKIPLLSQDGSMYQIG